MAKYRILPSLFSAIIIFTVGAGFHPRPLFRATPEVVESPYIDHILSEMQKISETTKDIKADMRLLIYDAEFEETSQRSGFFYLIKKGELLRLVFEKPHPREWYVDEKYFIEYFPDTRYASRWRRKKEERRFEVAKSALFFGIGTTVEELKKSFEITLLKAEEPSQKTRARPPQAPAVSGKKFILQLIPKTDEIETPYHKIHISVLEGQWFPFEVKGFKSSGDTETWIFSQIKINSALKEKEVRFRPPKGVVIEDEE